MPTTLYEEDEVYLTEEAVKYATRYDKAVIAYYLIKRLLDNGQSKDAKIEVVLSRCANDLREFVI